MGHSATTTAYAYDNAGRKTSETDALGHVTNYTYDAAGNLTAIAGVKGNFTYAYDNARNRISTTDGNNNKTQYQYDARKRLTLTTYPDATTKTNAYDGPGNLVSVTDQANNVVQYTYDAANQLASVVQVNSPNSSANTTIYGYDSNGNPITLEDANTHTTVNSFDLLSEMTSKTLPDNTLTEARTYDNNGNLASVAHFNGVSTTYTYDTLNRLLSRATPGEATVSFTYTSTGKRQTMTDASGTTNYSYDSMDRLSSKATPEGTLSYTYDAAGNLASMQSADGAVNVTYNRDSLNRLQQAIDSRLGTTGYTYDDASNVATVTYPSGIEAQFTYDTLNRVATATSQVSGYTYQRGATGNLTNVVELGGRNVTWNYDGIYRLTQESIQNDQYDKGGLLTYGLDPVGNRTSATSGVSGLSPVGGSFNADDEISSESYDQNGNVLTTGGKTFTYDSENQLMSMGSTVALLYDGDGNRVAKSVSGTITRYLVDDLNPTGYSQVVEELSGTGTVTRTYTYGLQRISEYQPISNVWTASFYGYDGGGNVRQLTNVNGAVTDTYEYDAFGNSFTVSGTSPNSYLYRGEQFDSDLGLYYLRARYYNPLTGRFMSRDPIATNLFTLNRYSYVRSNPTNRVDPSGREDEVDYPTLVLKKAVGAMPYLNAFSCAIGGTLAITEATLEGFDYKNPVNDFGAAGTIYGCITMTGSEWLGISIMANGWVNVGLCAVALGQEIEDGNEYLKDPTNEYKLRKFDYDTFSGLVGCGAAAIGAVVGD